MRTPLTLQRWNLLGIEEQELSILLTDVCDTHLGARGKGDVDTIPFSQLDRITTDVDLDRSASGGTGVVAGPLDEVSVDVDAFSSVDERGGRREDGGENVKWRVDRGGASRLALINDILTVLNSRCDNVCPLVVLFSIGVMPMKRQKSRVWSVYAPIGKIAGRDTR